MNLAKFAASAIAVALLSQGLAQAQTAPTNKPAAPAATKPAPATETAAAISPAKKALIDKIIKLQQPGIEMMGAALAEGPARELVSSARGAVASVPEGKREALVKDLDTDLKKYFDETIPAVRKRAVEMAPGTLTPVLDQRFTEDELKQLVALLESPINAKFQSAAAEMQRALGTKLAADARPTIEPRVRALGQSVNKRLRDALTPAAGAAPAGAAPAASAGK